MYKLTKQTFKQTNRQSTTVNNNKNEKKKKKKKMEREKMRNFIVSLFGCLFIHSNTQFLSYVSLLELQQMSKVLRVYDY